MAKIGTILCIMVAIAFNACAKTPQDNYYDRAKNSSNEALKSLDEE